MNPFLNEYESDNSEKLLVKKALEGDKKAIEELLKIHQPYIYNIAWKMVRDPNDAADLTQEVMIKIVTNLAGFSFRSSFRTWVYRIVVNHFLNQRKKSNENMFNSFDAMDNILSSIEDRPMTEIEQKESKEVIKEMKLMCLSGMLLCLNREQRMIYIIGDMLGGNHTIGSEIMGIKKDNFRAKLKKARLDLYTFMNNKCGLANKNNPCRCHKKVSVAVENEVISTKNLLFNKHKYSSFLNEISKDPDFKQKEYEKVHTKLYSDMPYKKDFDKKGIIQDLIESNEWRSRFNLD